MVGLLLLGLFVGFLLVIPLMILGLALRLVFAIVLLPFRLAGFAIKLTLGIVAGVIGLVAIGAALLIPLLPVLLLAGGFWLVWRLARRRPAAPQPTF